MADCKAKNRFAKGAAHGSKTQPDRTARGDAHYLKITPGQRRGTANPAARLTDDAIREIRAAVGVPVKTLAERYEVSESLIYKIRAGTSWSHVN